MDINKAIRKQNKAYKRFMLAMCFIFFILPCILYFSKKFSLFLLIYLIILELLIVTAVFFRLDWENLKYECQPGKIKIIQGYLKKSYNINCEKVVFVHVEQCEDKENINLIILTSSKFRNRNIKPVDNSFLKLHAFASHEYKRIKSTNPEDCYYYIVITKGGLLKDKLLVDIYRNCVKAKYSTEAIERIKRWIN